MHPTPLGKRLASMSGLQPLNPLDACWLLVDSPDTPMHVTSVLIFSPPEDVPPDFIETLVGYLKGAVEYAPPWNLKLQSVLGRIVPLWQAVPTLDMDYHVRRCVLPAPGGGPELEALVSQLHGQRLDLALPLWECHVVEGLEGGRFALCVKVHHALMDGVAGMRLLRRGLSEDPTDHDYPPPWAVPGFAEQSEASDEEAFSFADRLHALRHGLRDQLQAVPDLGRALGRFFESDRERGALIAPFSAPHSILNGRVTGARRFAIRQYDLATLKNLARRAGASFNDVVLCLCSTALRRFLLDAQVLPGQSLTAGVPVNVRPAGDGAAGNAISLVMAHLATDVADPRQRLAAIKLSMRSAKRHLQRLPRNALTQYTLLMMAPYILQLLSGTGGRTRPVFNLTISNAPGPDRPLYLRGARLEAVYPASVLSHGQALNISCLSDAEHLNVGYTGASDVLPNVQNLAAYTDEALQELEQTFGA
ncbi:MAG: wax ester/triacylglycerol synthase family O-acyltransferase [Nevskiales bacterium]|nr:wax ester/triacylglycerol synthase family O-acyltransferase [Nevskiales bacterium]